MTCRRQTRRKLVLVHEWFRLVCAASLISVITSFTLHCQWNIQSCTYRMFFCSFSGVDTSILEVIKWLVTFRIPISFTSLNVVFKIVLKVPPRGKFWLSSFIVDHLFTVVTILVIVVVGFSVTTSQRNWSYLSQIGTRQIRLVALAHKMTNTLSRVTFFSGPGSCHITTLSVDHCRSLKMLFDHGRFERASVVLDLEL